MSSKISSVACEEEVMHACKHFNKMQFYEKEFGRNHLITLATLVFSYIVVLRYVNSTEWIVAMTILLLSCLASIIIVRAMNLFSKILKGISSVINFILLALCVMVLFDVASVDMDSGAALIVLQKSTLWPEYHLFSITFIWGISALINSFTYLALWFVHMIPKPFRIKSNQVVNSTLDETA